jgi:hypothetical protein
MKKQILFFATLFVLFPFFGVSYAHEILVNTEDGETFVFDIDPTESLGSLQQRIIALSNGKKSNLLIEFPSEKNSNFDLPLAAHGEGLGYPRNYLAEVTSAEKNDIRYILSTLANKNLAEIFLAKEKLEAAGSRVDLIHPLRFLSIIFAEDEFLVYIHNIRKKGIVWGHFFKGLKNCLSAEAEIKNMKEEYVCHFSQIVKINPNLIMRAVAEQQWEDFVDLLIKHVPRKGNYDRYDMAIDCFNSCRHW